MSVLLRPLSSLLLLASIGAVGIACTATSIGTGTGPAPSSTESPPPPTSDTTGTDAGAPATLYATYAKNVAPSPFFSPSASSYAGGYTVITGQALVDPDPGSVHTLPTVLDLTLRFPSAPGTYTCAQTGNIAAELDASYDSNANEKQVGTTVGNEYSSCTITVTTFDEPSGRLVGTFEADLDTTGKLSGGVFDIPHGAAQ